jgi:L-amino acid N-acyltransferase YncA
MTTIMCSFGWSEISCATFETRDIATRPATRCKAYYYSLDPINYTIFRFMTLIRPSTDTDIPAITGIYAHHVLHGTGTFETEPPSQAEMASRRADVLGKKLPYLVIQVDGNTLGFAYANWFKPRPAYRFSVEDSIYMADGSGGKGLGKLLLTELLAQLERGGIRKSMAVIGDSENKGSIGVHLACGFSHIGIVKSCGWKFGQWRDIVLMEKTLGLGDSTPAQ